MIDYGYTFAHSTILMFVFSTPFDGVASLVLNVLPNFSTSSYSLNLPRGLYIEVVSGNRVIDPRTYFCYSKLNLTSSNASKITSLR